MEKGPRAGSIFAYAKKWEAMAGAFTGVQRYLYNLYAKSKKRNWVRNPNWDGWKNDIEGSIAEMMFAKFRRQYWDFNVYTKRDRRLFKAGDVGGFEVRWTERLNGSLILRTDDSPGSYFVLVVGECPNYWIVGWIKAVDGMKDEYLDAPHDGPESWFVPQSALTLFKTKGEQ
jgi:hypothetical protein